MNAQEFTVFFVRSVSVVIATVGIPTAFLGAVVGWHEMALVGCAATIAAGTVITLTNGN